METGCRQWSREQCAHSALIMRTFAGLGDVALFRLRAQDSRLDSGC